MHEKMFFYSSISLPALLLKRGLHDRFKLPVSAPFFSTKALWGWWRKMGAKKVSFIACHLGELYLACTSPKVFPTSLKKFDEQNWLHRASYRVRQKMGNSAAFSREIMQQERSIMRQIMRFFESWFNIVFFRSQRRKPIFLLSNGQLGIKKQ